MKFCAAPGCPKLVDRGYCDEHDKAKRKQISARRAETPNAYDYRWQRFRAWCMHALLYQRFGGCCVLCRIRFERESDVNWDHIIPLSKGGERIAENNVQPLCQRCNSRKGDRILGDGTTRAANTADGFEDS